MKYSGIGGQAVMEGVMMRNQDKYAVAVRKENGEIAVEKRDCKAINNADKLKNIPFLRGIISFIDSLYLGVTSLMISASFFEDEEPLDNDDKSSKKENAMLGMVVVVSLLFAIGIFMVLPYYLSQLLSLFTESAIVISIAEGILRIAIFFGYLLLISNMKDIQRVFMYHGAEHKCINCIESGLELNVENVKKSSRQHKRCGTNFLFIVIIISVIFFIFLRSDSHILRLVYRLILIPVVAGVSYEILRFGGMHDGLFVKIITKPGLLLQNLTTREPDDKMIEVGMASVEAVFDWKEFLTQSEKSPTSKR